MKSLEEYINKTSNSVKHKDNKDSGEFYVDDNNKLLYYNDVITYPEATDNAIELCEIYVTNKNKHIGTDLVNALVNFAKSQHKDVVTYASPLTKDMTEDELISFYNKCGFENDSRTKDKHCLINKYTKD
jgi:hypothetical protein